MPTSRDVPAPESSAPAQRGWAPFPRLLRRAAAAAWVVAGLLATGCAAGPRALDFKAATARAMGQSAYADPSSRSQTIVAMDVLTVASLVPEPTAMAAAVGVIEENAGAERGALAGAVSLATWEGARRYIGETYERAYASIIGGVAYWMMGEHQNAAALWRNAAAIDGESDEGFREDFGAANFLLARWYHRKKDWDNARIYRERLLRTHPRAERFLTEDALDNHNLVVLVENGYGPRKTPTGPGGSILEYGPASPQFSRAQVFVDGEPIGTAEGILDVRTNAEHSLRPNAKVVWQAVRGTGAQAALGYSVYRLTEDPALGFLAASLVDIFPADVRQWWGVPAELLVLTARVPAGARDVEVRVDSRSGGLTTRFRAVPISDGPWETILLVRPVRGYPERTLPPAAEAAKARIQPDRKALATDPSLPVIQPGSINPDLWEKSPVYRYLPPPAKAPAPVAGAPARSATPETTERNRPEGGSI